MQKKLEPPSSRQKGVTDAAGVYEAIWRKKRERDTFSNAWQAEIRIVVQDDEPFVPREFHRNIQIIGSTVCPPSVSR